MEMVNQLAYVVLGAKNLNEWERFATEILGLQVGEKTDDRLLLRMDSNAYRLWIQKSDVEDILTMGWQVSDEYRLEAMTKQLEKGGVKVKAGTAEEIAARKVLGLIKTTDPSGLGCEVCYGAQVQYEKPFVSPRSISGFLTGDQGLGHCTMGVDNLEASAHFYGDILGMKISDWIVHYDEHKGENDEIPQGLKIAFYHCNPRHHSLAFWQGKAPGNKHLHHVMIQVNSVDDVGSTFDLCIDKGVPRFSTIGRHSNDFMFSFYLGTPSGFGIEYGWGARTVDDSVWQVQLQEGSGSIWGHRPVPAQP